MLSRNYSALAICSKDLDFINFLEFCWKKNIPLSKVHVFIIGSGERQDSVKTLVDIHNVGRTSLPDIDLYSSLSSKFLSFGKNSFFKKILIVLISYGCQHIYRFVGLVRWKKKLKAFSANIIYLDLWRTKIPILSYTSYRKIVIGDGGVSTESLNLTTLWNRYTNKFEVLFFYLKEQQDLLINRSNIRGFKLFFYKLHTYLVYSYSDAILKEIERKWPEDVIFFTSYSGGKGILSNEYDFFRQQFNSFSKEDYTLVVGYPEFGTLQTSITMLGKTSQDVVYNFHPRDKQLFKKNKKLKLKSYAVINDLGWKIEDTNQSLESILISRKSIPARIITYETSLIAFIANVLPEETSIDFVKIENLT